MIGMLPSRTLKNTFKLGKGNLPWVTLPWNKDPQPHLFASKDRITPTHSKGAHSTLETLDTITEIFASGRDSADNSIQGNTHTDLFLREDKMTFTHIDKQTKIL